MSWLRGASVHSGQGEACHQDVQISEHEKALYKAIQTDSSTHALSGQWDSPTEAVLEPQRCSKAALHVVSAPSRSRCEEVRSSCQVFTGHCIRPDLPPSSEGALPSRASFGWCVSDLYIAGAGHQMRNHRTSRLWLTSFERYRYPCLVLARA
jgi:hypothetical protein